MITDLLLRKLNIEMSELTNNTIVIFNNFELKNKFVTEFLKIKNRKSKDVFYVLDSEEDYDIKEFLMYRPTTIYNVDNEQKFIFTTEAPFILQCKEAYDLWFCNTNKDDVIQLFSFVEFKGYKEDWDEGVYEVYKKFLNGLYGVYEGYGR